MALPVIKGVTSCSWRPEIEIDLIEEVKKRNHLWDPKDPLYTKKSFKKPSYGAVAKILRQRWPLVSVLFTGDSVNKKFASLKAYYTREYRKMKDLNSMSKAFDFRPKWFHFKRLSFLKHVIAHEDNIVTHENGSVTHEDNSVTHEVNNVTHEDNSGTHKDNIVTYEDDIVIHEDGTSSLNDSPLQSDTELEAGFNTEVGVSRVKLEPVELSEPSDSAFEVSSISSSKELEKLPVDERKNVTTRRHSKEINHETRNCTQKVKQNYDAEYFFGMFIACQLRRIQDPMQRDLASIEIQRLLIKYKYGADVSV